MTANELARYMRDRALLIEGDERLDESSLRRNREVEFARARKKQRVSDMQKLYFNAGRWVGGARDYAARLAYEDMKRREELTHHRVK